MSYIITDRFRCFSVCVCSLCCTDLKPQLEEAKERLEDAKTKQADVMKNLETVQNNLNFTSSTHIQHRHTYMNRNTHT